MQVCGDNTNTLIKAARIGGGGHNELCGRFSLNLGVTGID